MHAGSFAFVDETIQILFDFRAALVACQGVVIACAAWRADVAAASLNLGPAHRAAAAVPVAARAFFLAGCIGFFLGQVLVQRVQVAISRADPHAAPPSRAASMASAMR